MEKPIITKECAKALSETKFLNTYDLQYAEGAHYYIATRRNVDNLTATKSIEEQDHMLPDAVTCFIIIKQKGEEDCLLLQYEYRFPIGQYVLCPPAGIIDAADCEGGNPLITATIREIKEETGLDVKDTDKIYVLNDLLFSTPGFTDECNALVVAEIELDDLSQLSHEYAEATELFGDFLLVTKKDAKNILKRGRDPKGHHIPLYAYAALSYFVLKEE
ncbi:MAG: NUDIX hydrolase [Bacillota bacterium]|nr:NUDIX hydrolase [Bacillota bacterium]